MQVVLAPCPPPPEAGLAEVEAVPAEPADSFAERCCAALAAAVADGRPIDVVYVSTTTYLTQQTLVPSISAFVRGLRAAAASAGSGGSGGSGDTTTCAHASPAPDGRVPDALPTAPLIILDGYHGFAALPTDLAEVAGDCCYVAGMLKHAGDRVPPAAVAFGPGCVRASMSCRSSVHSTRGSNGHCCSHPAGCGANCAFMTLPTQLAAAVRPVLTGWLADLSVLSPSSTGISFGSEVGRGSCPVETTQRMPDSRSSRCCVRPLMEHWGRGHQLKYRSTPTHLLPCRLASAPTWCCRAAPPRSCCRCSPSTTSCRQGRCGVGRCGMVGNVNGICPASHVVGQSIIISVCGRLCSLPAGPSPHPHRASIVLQLWREAQPQPITVEGLHRHVMGLHAAFLSGLDAAGHPTINSSTLLPPQVRGG